MARMTQTSKANLLAADRVEITENDIWQTYTVFVYRGEKRDYLKDSEGSISFDSIQKARRTVKRHRPDLEPTTI